MFLNYKFICKLLQNIDCFTWPFFIQINIKLHNQNITSVENGNKLVFVYLILVLAFKWNLNDIWMSFIIIQCHLQLFDIWIVLFSLKKCLENCNWNLWCWCKYSSKLLYISHLIILSLVVFIVFLKHVTILILFLLNR